MEFSEEFELTRLSKSRKLSTESILSKLTKHRNLATLHTVHEYTEHSEKKSNSHSGRKIYNDQEDVESELKFEKDNSYLNKPKHAQRSSLTLLLQQPEGSFGSFSGKLLNLVVYFFRTMNRIKLAVPQEITAADTIIKALLAYDRAGIGKLPHGLDSQGYELWIADEETCLPDTDYTISANKFVALLGVKTLCICEKPDYRSSIYQSNNGSSLITKNAKPGSIHARFFFENSSTVVAVKPESELREVLIILWKKFYVFGNLNTNDFEFRVFIKEIGHECGLDMGLMIKELPGLDIRLYRKVLADSPQVIHKKQSNSHIY